MAPRTVSPKRKPREDRYLFDLGVRGRKTGITVPDNGMRDEHGLENTDHIFSSPEKSKPPRPKRNGAGKGVDATMSSEEDMDVGESTIPEPAAVLAERKRAMRMPPPRSKSPMKTYLQSPPRRHPSLVSGSSALRGSIMTPSGANELQSVKRKLNFSVDGLSIRAAERGSPQKRPMAKKPAAKSAGKSATSRRLFSPKLKPAFRSNLSDNDQDEPYQIEGFDNEENPYQNINDDDEHITKAEQYQDRSSRVEETTNGVLDTELDSPLKPTKKRGRPPIAKSAIVREEKGRPPKKSVERPDRVENDVEEVGEIKDDVEERPAKKPRGQAKKSATVKSVPQRSRKPAMQNSRSVVAKPNSSPVNVSSPAVVQRGPPRPKSNRGLYILRRETPDDSSHTRSGRHVIKPLAYWKNETVVYGEDQGVDGDTNFLLPTIKEVIRAEEVEEENPRKGTKKGTSKPKKRRQATDLEEEDSEDLAEPWETEPGRIYGEVRVWDPEDLVDDILEETEEIALSSSAIITTNITGTTVRYAKTFTLPFFGSGMVDLPSGSIKKTKNSRRMQMVFFVFYGRVSVTVNGNAFRIGKGGMWQVPRGNFYSIENDYDKPARIFFAQGREMGSAEEDDR